VRTFRACVQMAMAHKFLEDTPVQGGVQRMWECLITYNARKDSKSTPDDSMVPTIDVPTIVNPSRPSDLKKMSLEKYIEDGP